MVVGPGWTQGMKWWGIRLEWFLGGVFLLLLVGRTTAIYTENVNWDEFALLARAMDSVRTGELQGGGRPGLATLLLIPLVRECQDALAVIHRARWLWTGITLTFVVGFWFLLRGFLRSSEWATEAAFLGVALLVLVPVFLRWSIHVRTDQPALALGVWGGVALFASRGRLAWALLAGMLFGAGYLFTQKVVYVAALGALMAVGQYWMDGGRPWSRAVMRGGLCALGGWVVLVGFDALIDTWYAVAGRASVTGGFAVFDFYRQTLGYRVYIGMLPALIPHLVLMTLLVAALLRFRTGSSPHRERLLLGVGILNLGALVALFHAGAFPYFWMTLGLFPAAAVAVSFPALMAWVDSTRARGRLVGGSVLVLTVAALPAGASLLPDTQRVQRESFEFIATAFAAEDRGFHPERALFCRNDPEPFPTFFTQNIWGYFGRPAAPERVRDFIEEFRTRPVMFIVDSYRLEQFPAEVRAFMDRAYVQYRAGVMVPGVALTPSDRAEQELEVVVAGAYGWWPFDVDRDGGVMIDDRELVAGEWLYLDRGTYAVRSQGGNGGRLALRVAGMPQEQDSDFYSGGALAEFRGRPWLPRMRTD